MKFLFRKRSTGAVVHEVEADSPDAAWEQVHIQLYKKDPNLHYDFMIDNEAGDIQLVPVDAGQDGTCPNCGSRRLYKDELGNRCKRCHWGWDDE